jgi:hypothetical protein
MMTAEEAAIAAKGLTFEKVWMTLQETDRQIKELSGNGKWGFDMSGILRISG